MPSYACRNGHKNNVDNNKKIDIHTDSDAAFRYACENDHYVVAEWLQEISKNLV